MFSISLNPFTPERKRKRRTNSSFSSRRSSLPELIFGIELGTMMFINLKRRRSEIKRRFSSRKLRTDRAFVRLLIDCERCPCRRSCRIARRSVRSAIPTLRELGPRRTWIGSNQRDIEQRERMANGNEQLMADDQKFLSRTFSHASWAKPVFGARITVFILKWFSFRDDSSLLSIYTSFERKREKQEFAQCRRREYIRHRRILFIRTNTFHKSSIVFIVDRLTELNTIFCAPHDKDKRWTYFFVGFFREAMLLSSIRHSFVVKSMKVKREVSPSRQR